ncbi:hypothetical protein ARMSODRAFT_1021398 [Armillaria solidipes]|uniref:Uncharacterized protein n=1 Tax=Armillaria solidipes TaxID=1076256 RepID=A0A2H3BCF7_9AGAR|nr:hypothetical protein ARMSODRAFT_1021398 [Armillaria solidipes]
MAASEQMNVTTGPSHQRSTATASRSSSEEFPPHREESPRNATPGPSNVPRTPDPVCPSTAEEYGWDLQTRYQSPSPPPYSPPIQTRVLVPFLTYLWMDHPHARPPTHPIHVPTGRFPSDSKDSDSDTGSETPRPSPKRAMTLSTPTALTMSGQNSPPSTDRSSVHTAPRPGNFDERTLKPVLPTSGPMPVNQWTTSSLSTGEISFLHTEPLQPLRPGSSPIETEAYTILQLGIKYTSYERELPRSSEIWKSPYMPLPWKKTTDPIWTELVTYNNFDNFHYDKGTFRGYTPDPWAPSGYTAEPYALPDPPSLLIHQIRQYGQYHSSKTSYLIGGDDHAGGSNEPPINLPQPSAEE